MHGTPRTVFSLIYPIAVFVETVKPFSGRFQTVNGMTSSFLCGNIVLHLEDQTILCWSDSLFLCGLNMVHMWEYSSSSFAIRSCVVAVYGEHLLLVQLLLSSQHP